MLDTDRYAGKKRKKPVQKQKPAIDATKSNPSKRHRDRLNGELERLTNMLPFTEDVCSRLDKLSVLRLSVGYLKAKSFFNAAMKKNNLEFPTENGLGSEELDAINFSESDLLLQALNGFVMVVTAEGYVFYASPTIQDYLGFHQSDMVHQSVFEFIHIDDRAMFRRQLHFALNPKLLDGDKESNGMESSSDITRNIVTYDPQHIPPENSSFLERSFVCRFRCLLDNSSGFLKLNFQGRLKFLLGQNQKAEDGSLVQPQLALFAVATPVQPPAILEIRTKTLIFQTKHKLDFTPLGIDSRGKVVLGYSEMELCMRGSGYQFIHAADMMHCADNHVRMIKTGESGMTVFRLLTKNGGWIWVQANARLVYKGGHPDFIIARQRALVNAEGEEHLRQRRLQLPFSLTTGEAVLYDSSPALDVMNSESTKKEPSVQNGNDEKTLEPSSILASMQRQDVSIYQQPTEPEFAVDDAFVDSWALFNVPSHASQNDTMKEEEDAVVSMIDALEQLAQGGDLCTALQQMEVDSTELKQWENALLRMAKEGSGSEKALNFDEILTSNIFTHVEDALYKEVNKGPISQPNPSTAAKTNSFGVQSVHPGQYPATAVQSECGFTTVHSFESRLDFVGMTGQDMIAMVGAPENSQRLSHSSSNTTMGCVPGHQTGTSPLKSINNLHSHSGQNGLELFTQTQKHLAQKNTPSTFSIIPSNGWEPQQNVQNGKVQMSAVSSCQFRPYHVNQTENRQIHNLLNGFYQLSHPTANHQNSMVLGTGNHNPSLSPCKNNASSESPSIPNLQSIPWQSHMQPSQQWQQALPEQPCPGLVKNRLVHGGYQNSEAPGFPLVNLLSETSSRASNGCKNTMNDANHAPMDRLAPNHCPPLSSCMYESHSPPSTKANWLHPQAQAVTISSFCKETIPNNQSPPQASCYFQWMHNEPVVGTSSIPQVDVCISPPSCDMVPGKTSPSQSVFKQYNGCNGQTQVESHPVEYSSPFSIPPLVNGIHVPESSKANCCKL
ncbi:aryl hydrocarbon receptor 2 [Salminus brasiliensis]|uniref:aryl hydrocarbon receptor 2 n=1 Tax=Salminus brasiliensis TaxID=930266 RepID=UPI003B8395A3